MEEKTGNAETITEIAETLMANQTTKKLWANVLKSRLLQHLGISQPESSIKTNSNLSHEPRSSEYYTGVNCLDARNFNLFFIVLLFFVNRFILKEL